MTLYPGSRSLDAELTLDFSDNSLIVDYSKNKMGWLADSNTSVHFNSDWPTQPRKIKTRQFLVFVAINLMRAVGILAIYVLITTYLFEKNIIADPKWQYNHQRFLAWVYMNCTGIVIIKRTTTEGKRELAIPISNNLFLDYELSGDFQSKIQSISLMRHFETYLKFGKHRETRQIGWDAIFRFSGVPENGDVTIRYIR